MKKKWIFKQSAAPTLATLAWACWEKDYIKNYHKAELVQVNYTPIICLRNFINKKVGNPKN